MRLLLLYVVPFICSLWPHLYNDRAVPNSKPLSVLFICRVLQGPVYGQLLNRCFWWWQKKGLGKLQFSQLIIVPLPQSDGSWNGDPGISDASQKLLANRSSRPRTITIVSCLLAPGKLIITGQGSNLFVFGSDSKRLSAGFALVQITACGTELFPTITFPAFTVHRRLGPWATREAKDQRATETLISPLAVGLDRI